MTVAPDKSRPQRLIGDQLRMTSIRDLEPCQYTPVECDALVAIGWLGKEAAFETGPVAERFFRKLMEFCADPWQPVASAGFHFCELCQFEAPAFSANVFVPYQGRIYVAPVAIVHYIAAHWYQPPQIFVDAVVTCPAIRSMDYKKAILANGGRNLAKAVTGTANRA
jgi:hypothetical protein